MITTSSLAVGNWEVVAFKDQFGDATDDQYILGGPFYGTFSNRTTSNGDLVVFVYCLYGDILNASKQIVGNSDDLGDMILFRILEYGKYPISGKQYKYGKFSRYYVNVKLSDGTIQKLYGSMPKNGTDMSIGSRAIAEDSSKWTEGMNQYPSVAIDLFKKGGKYKFAVSNIDSSVSTYNFEIDAKGFTETYNNWKSK